MWHVDPNATERFIEAVVSAHIVDRSNLDMPQPEKQTRNITRPHYESRQPSPHLATAGRQFLWEMKWIIDEEGISFVVLDQRD